MSSRELMESFVEEAKDFLIKVECPCNENVCKRDFYDILFNRHELKNELLAWLFSKINSRFQGVYDERNAEASLMEIATSIGVCRSGQQLILNEGGDLEIIISFWRKIFHLVEFSEECDSFFEKETYKHENFKYSCYMKNLLEETTELMDSLALRIFDEKKNSKKSFEPSTLINYESKINIVRKRLERTYDYNKKKFMATLMEYTEAGVDFDLLIDGKSPKDGLESSTTSIVDLKKINKIGEFASALENNYLHLINFSKDVMKVMSLNPATLKGFSEIDGSKVAACEKLSGDLLYHVNQMSHLCSEISSFKSVMEQKPSLEKQISFLDSGTLRDLLKIANSDCGGDCGHQNDILAYPKFR